MTPHPVFVVGCPRSGTGLLRDLLRSHPSLAFPTESHFIPAFHRGYGDPRDEAEALALARRILGLRWVRAWRLPLEPRDLAHHRSYAALVDDLFTAYARRAGRPRWGDKTPQYVRAMPQLRELFPHARFVHIVRDGRDVCRSVVAAAFGPRNLVTAAAWWRGHVAAGRADGARLGPKAYLEVRYEDLLAEPEEVMRGVVAFVEEPWDDAVLRPSRRDPIRPERAASWRIAMPREDRRIVEAVAGDLLAELGYDVPDPPGTIGAHERAVARIDHAARILALRLRRRDRSFWTTELELRRAAWRARLRGGCGGMV
ncbi:MAG TPA: sulfotransferase [Solirubrobacteraceae bacterium]|jgi:hypothetical protein